MKAGDIFKEIADKKPEHLLQPWIDKDRTNGNKYYVNPEYVKRYGNPYNNEENKMDIYIDADNLFRIKNVPTYEIGLNRKQQKQNVKNKLANDLKRFWHTGYKSYSDIQCKYCSAFNNTLRAECWACLQKIEIK